MTEEQKTTKSITVTADTHGFDLFGDRYDEVIIEEGATDTLVAIARCRLAADGRIIDKRQSAKRRSFLNVHVTVDDLRPEMERLVNASLAESDRAQVGRVGDFAEEYRQQFIAAASRPQTPGEFIRSMHVNVATDVLQPDYPADLLAPKLAALALDGEVGEWLTDAELRLIVFGFELADAARGGG